MGLAKTYTAVRLEAASQRALLLHAHSYQSLKSILKRSLDRQTELQLEVEKPGPKHDNIRGATYYDPPPSSLLQQSNHPNQEINMLNQPTMERLQAMKLHGMAQAFREQYENADSSQLSFEERFGLLVDCQWTWKENRALTRRLQLAKFKERGLIEDIDYQHPRGLDRRLMRTLASSDWVRQHQNLLLIGPTGIGKSWLACALAHKACRDGFFAIHKRMAELFRDLAVARADGSIGSVLAKLARTDVLVLDDFAMAPMKDSERRDFLEICDDRYQRRSTVLTSQVPVAHWHEQIGDPSIADSIMDRLVHNAHRMDLDGESIRKKRGRKPAEEDGK
jgi:DNA replication protein DnaC